MMNKSQFFEGVERRNRGGLHVQMWEREQPGSPPTLNDGLGFGCPHQVRGTIRSSLLNWNVVVWASNLVLSTVLALRKAFIASNMSFLASLTTLARLGVAAGKYQQTLVLPQYRRAFSTRTFDEGDHRQDRPFWRMSKGIETKIYRINQCAEVAAQVWRVGGLENFPMRSSERDSRMTRV